MRMIDQDGYQRFTIRALAAELGIAAMSVYSYFPSRKDIDAAIGERLLGKLGASMHPSASWDMHVDRVIRDLYDVMAAHPGAIDIFVAELSAPPARDRVTDHVRESLLSLTLDGGLSEQDAADVVGVLIDFVLGHAIVQRNYALRKRQMTHVPNADPDTDTRYPSMVRVAQFYNADSLKRTFDFGLGLLMAGIRERFADRIAGHTRPSA